ncbi:helix-turn-helix domain-containing protein [Streptomyces virginiae]|uniref:helix-turn-helix domain-containing protein n=1 Tax=Streptomyces virginiae TaxID=1961 RepID=UPI003794A31E
MESYEIPRWQQIADAETARIRHAEPGAAYPSYDELTELYGCGRSTVFAACRELKRRGLIRRGSGFRGTGHVLTGATMGEELTPEYIFRRYRDDGALWPSAGPDNRCPVPGCGRALRNVPRPVYGYACSNCIQNGAVISTRAA